MNREERRAAEEYLRKANAQYPEYCVEIPEQDWPPSLKSAIAASVAYGSPARLVRVFRSRDYLVQIFEELQDHARPDLGYYLRMSVCRTVLDPAAPGLTKTADGIPWDDLQRLKTEVGHGQMWALEVFPPPQHLVYHSNMRHLWLFRGPPPFAWLRQPTH